MADKATKSYKIAVDAGHGYNTPGKRSPDGEREWSFNNVVVLAIVERLKEYRCFDVLRTDDPTGKTDVPLADRVTKAIKFNADIFVSAHQNANAGVYGSHGGTETYYYGPSTNGKLLANYVQPRLISALGLRNRGVKASDDLYVLRGFRSVKTVAILAEGAFMDSYTDIVSLRDDAKLKAQGYAIADGIAEYLGVILPKKSEVKGVSYTKVEPKEDDEMKLNETGRQAAREMIKRAVTDGTFTSKHENVDKYDDGELVSYALAYVNRKLK